MKYWLRVFVGPYIYIFHNCDLSYVHVRKDLQNYAASILFILIWLIIFIQSAVKHMRPNQL